MKTRTNHSLAMLLCSFTVLFLFGCGSNGGGSTANINLPNPLVGESSSNTNTANSQNPLAGTWVSGGYSLTFKSDNTYLRDFNQEGIPAVRGSVTVSGNVIIVTDSGSCITGDTGRIESGSYTYTIVGNTLTLNLFHDPCSDRAAFLGQTYTRQ
ncbi:MAG TPA: hypothetical protein VL087_11325 [Nitrospirota bacterium]|nr:hypothetical protein [Nitrospirota bacterium]